MTFSETLKETVRKALRAAGPTLRRFWSSMALSIALTVTAILNMSNEFRFLSPRSDTSARAVLSFYSSRSA